MTSHMAHGRSDKDSGISGVRKAGGDAVQLTIDYLKQETLGPLKGLGRFLAWGIGGSVAIAIGLLLILIGVLRVLQDETGAHLSGDWSWVPYFVVSVLGIAMVAIAGWRITSGPAKRRVPKSTTPNPPAPVIDPAPSPAVMPAAPPPATEEGTS